MEHNDMKLGKHYDVLRYLSLLPRKIVSLHGYENVPEFVFHDLCDECCFNLSKAAYFVDNPDFDCFKGVVGFCKTECYKEHENIWEHPESFSSFMQKCSFNQEVRSFLRQSIKKSHQKDQIVRMIAKELDFNNPEYYCWDMRHDNHGLMVYEKTNDQEEIIHDHLEAGVSLLSLCPVF